MATSTTPQKPQSLPTTNHKPVEAVKAPEPAVTPVETPKTEATVDAKSTTIISITVDEKLARQARFLARAKGVSISSLFTDAAAREIPLALKAALADLQGDLE